MNWKDALPGVPSWHERPSGLLIPTDIDRPAVPDSDEPLPAGLPVRPPDLVVLGRPPSSFEQFRVYPDESVLGLPVSTPEELAEAVGELTFGTTMLALARLAAHVNHMRGDTRAQLELAGEVFGDPSLLAGLQRFARTVNYELEVFPPQHITALQRLLVLHGREGAIGEHRPGEQAVFNRIFFAVAALSDERDLGSPHEEAQRDRWLAYLIQNGTYNSSDAPLESMTRHQVLFVEIAAELRDHRDYCPVDDWFIEDDGLSIAEQHALGFAVLATAKVMEEALQLSERSVLGPEFFQDLARRLGRDPVRVTQSITAPQSWYAERFTAGEQTVRRAAWDRAPFEIRPLVRLADGPFVLVSPWAINGWIGDGFYHRALGSARRRGQSERLLGFYGALVERYALRTLQEVHPEPRPPGSGRVFGEQQYGRGNGKRSPDVSVDCGPDLVLIEVTSGRFTLPTLVEGDAEKAAADLTRLLFGKLDQLGRRIDDFLAGQWAPPDVELDDVERIWPVLVTADMLQNDILWEEISRRTPTGLRRARVQRLTLLDVPDVEMLGAPVQRGYSLAQLLARKAAGPYARMDLRRFVFDTPGIPHEVRLSTVEERWTRTMAGVAQVLGFDVDEARIRQHVEHTNAAPDT